MNWNDHLIAARDELAHSGFSVIRGLLDEPTLETAMGIIRRAAKKVGINDIFDPSAASEIDEEAWGQIRINSHYRSRDELEQVYNSPRLLAAASTVLGTTARLFPVHKLRISAPDREFTFHPWHQDEATWPNMTGRNPITFWVPLVRVDERNGLALVPRSYDCLFEHTNEDGFLAIAGEWLVIDQRMPELQPGDAILFDAFTLHRSVPNHTDDLRLSLDFRYEAASNPVT